MALQKLNAQILEGGLTFDTGGNMTLTGNLYATDVGNDDDPIEDFYVSNESIWIGDQHKLQVSSTGKMKFRKRKVTTVPAVIVAAGGDSAGALTHSGKASFTIIAVPRTSRMSAMSSPAAKRWVTSTSGRSALPKKSMSALESNSTERRTFSLQ